MFLAGGGADVREEYDPLYNPDRYVDVLNATWRQLPNPNPRPGDELSDVTVFEFLMRNNARYGMTDLVIEATIKDGKGQELDRVEIAVEGLIPADGHTAVGTLAIGKAGATNAGLLVAAVLALGDEELAARLEAMRAEQTQSIAEFPSSDG